ncbi:hypothetical protein L227DRAFT_37122 [Lentinus tigrinus ALCF2SS1-6]|uniref:Uncharacterized protein n=1 Tax=Lentinus tigrinus ALCF2SS1-6 TaxID=1328759 RepID=A0A5C2SH14_9APHY|nr:hypothetical protein L227DRAFT_37122 [Lentinus tigrinus ALCF2SS1-6]
MVRVAVHFSLMSFDSRKAVLRAFLHYNLSRTLLSAFTFNRWTSSQHLDIHDEVGARVAGDKAVGSNCKHPLRGQIAFVPRMPARHTRSTSFAYQWRKLSYAVREHSQTPSKPPSVASSQPIVLINVHFEPRAEEFTGGTPHRTSLLRPLLLPDVMVSTLTTPRTIFPCETVLRSISTMACAMIALVDVGTSTNSLQSRFVLSTSSKFNVD